MPNAGLSPISLTLSDDIAVGTLNSSFIAIYLYASSFLAFAAGLFDLGHLLTHGRANPASGTGSDAVSGLIAVREVCLALSLGLLFIFLWHLVAHCPRNERRLPPDEAKSDSDHTAYVHSASWRRWGFIGVLLQWSLLGLTFSIPVLQIIWRISPPSVRFGTIYIAEATIEVVVSALFILKIVLNIFLSPLTPWWRPIQSNIAPLLALAISTGLGLGNLVALVFSETTLGRFLRAVEMYILILFVLVTAFYKIPSDPASLQNDPGRSFIRISEKPQVPPLRVKPPIPPLVTSLGIIPRRRSTNEPRRPSIATSLSRLSSWVLPHIAERRSSLERIYIEDRELGMAPGESAVAHTDSTRAKAEDTPKPPIRIDTNLASVDTNSEEHSAVSKDRPWTAISIPSYYGIPTDYPPPPPGVLTRETDSPVYGLNGIIVRTRDQAGQPRPHSNISFDELLRQQTELDKSIAALRLYSSEATSSPTDVLPPQPAVIPVSTTPKTASSPKTRSNSVSTNSYLGRKPDSASNRSEFSLSIFPEPPAVSSDESPTSSKLERFVGRARTLRREPVADKANEVTAIKVVGEGSPSLPVSPTRYEGTPRLESAGTQYDVTSFIGGLTLPTSGSALITGSGLATGGTTLSDVESGDEPSPQIAIRPMILAPSAVLASPADTDIASTANTDRSHEVLSSKREPSVPLRPFLLGTSSQAMPVMLPSSTMVPIGPRRKGLPSNPRRPTISGPSLPPDDGRGDQAPGAFERPRPPPLFLSK
ncbi:hypothetical protein FPV67DRAFT_1465417 [Lyophyllum atratum]|nr:hypothetical protein FPV67DRAFT_1465417 [Lyophyllum atratum]